MWYNARLVHLGCRFNNWFMEELNKVHSSYWNAESPLVFAVRILPTAENVRSSRNIYAVVAHQIDLWDQGHFLSLVEHTILSRHGGGRTWPGGFLSVM